MKKLCILGESNIHGFLCSALKKEREDKDMKKQEKGIKLIALEGET